jgi:pimeloyl-ACP methyl ester carboxylesterase
MKTLYPLASRRAIICYALLTLMIVSFTSSGQQIPKSLIAKNNVQIGFYEYKPTDYNLYPAKKYPLIIFLHGIGERGNGTTELSRVLSYGIPSLINQGATMKFNGETFLVLSPQLPTWLGSWENYYVDEMLDYAFSNLQVDTNRVYLTGLSLGGGGVWTYANTSSDHAKRFAAIAPVCGTCYYNYSTLKTTIGAAPIGVWGFTNMDDGVVSPWCTISACDALLNTSSAVRKTVNASGGHDAWTRAYDLGHSIQSPNLFEWMLGFTKASLQVLPLRLSEFNVAKRAGAVTIKWKSEADDRYNTYEVERSYNGKNFTLLSKVKGTGAGHNYTLVDYNNLQGSFYYRIKMTSGDASFEYSAIKEVREDNTGSYTVSLFDVTGRLVLKKKDINIQEMIAGIKRNGVYVLQVDDGKSITTSKISVLQ